MVSSTICLSDDKLRRVVVLLASFFIAVSVAGGLSVSAVYLSVEKVHYEVKALGTRAQEICTLPFELESSPTKGRR